MPFIREKGLSFYYETFGSKAAPPLLIISGLSDYTAKCKWQTADLSEDYFTVTFDNRGAGQSTTPPPGYTVPDMANDAVAVLDALEIPAAHVFGFSLGGMIALNLVLNHPERVHRLVLGCTTAGGRMLIQPGEQVVNALTKPTRTGDRRQDFLNGIKNSVSDQCIMQQPELIDALALLAERNPQTPTGYAGQIQAALGHDVVERLGEISSPTLVLHGSDDRVFPVENGRLLAAHIPASRYIEYPEAGHLFFIERAAEINRDIRVHLKETDRTRSWRGNQL